MHPVARQLVTNFAFGVALCWGAGAILVWRDALGLGALILSPGGWVAGVALALSAGGTCGVLCAATGLEFLAAADGGDGRRVPRPRVRVRRLAPATVGPSRASRPAATAAPDRRGARARATASAGGFSDSYLITDT